MRCLIAGLHRRTLSDPDIPFMDLCIGFEVNLPPLKVGYVGLDSHVGNSIYASNWPRQIILPRKARIEHAIQARGLFTVMLFYIFKFPGIIMQEMVGLSQHWPEATHLPHGPFHNSPVFCSGSVKAFKFIRLIQHDCNRFHQLYAGLVSYKDGDAVIGRYL